MRFHVSRRQAVAGAIAIAAAPVTKAAAQFTGVAPNFEKDNMGVRAGTGGDASALPMGSLSNPSGGRLQTMVIGRKYPRAAWAPELYAQTVLAEFAASDWQSIKVDGPNDNEPELREEIGQLLDLNKLRAERSAEIMLQLDNPLGYWSDLLSSSPATAPLTWTLIATAVAVGQLVSMHFKEKFGRPRPAMVYPALMPLAPTPRHPSYPSSHALQGHLIHQCLTPLATEPTKAALLALARRVAANREIAGFHFPSDTAAGERLAGPVYQKLVGGPIFNTVLTAANAEWK